MWVVLIDGACKWYLTHWVISTWNCIRVPLVVGVILLIHVLVVVVVEGTSFGMRIVVGVIGVVTCQVAIVTPYSTIRSAPCQQPVMVSM